MRSTVTSAPKGASRGYPLVLAIAALTLGDCTDGERTVEVIPLPSVVEQCLDELEAPDEPTSRLGIASEDIHLCIVLQGLDCVLVEPLCSAADACEAPRWSCPDPGLELESGDVVGARLFIVDGTTMSEACAEVSVGAEPACGSPSCLARIDYQLEYTGEESAPLRIRSDSARITHSGFLSETVGTFDTAPASICSAIDDFVCEGDGCGTPIRLEVGFGGIGTGRVIVNSDAQQGIECTAPRCTIFLPSDRGATLTATAAEGSVFGDWGEACADEGRSPTCVLEPAAETLVSARFAVPLSVEVLGEGTVRSDEGGIDGDGIECVAGPQGTECVEEFVAERRVVLAAQGSPEWPFSAWTGCDSVDGPTCVVTVDRRRDVRATFGRQVSVTVVGNGAVTVAPGGQVCSANCAVAFPPGTAVALTAQAGMGATRYDWQQVCAGEQSEVCDLGALNQNVSVTARFAYDVTTSVTAGQGTVEQVADVPPVACASGAASCQSYLPGTEVQLQAVAESSPPYAFLGWTGLCGAAMGNTNCVLSVGESGAVAAVFERAVRVGVQVVNRGQAAGTVTSSPVPNAGGCSVDCSDRYLRSTGDVTLTANIPLRTRFEGWELVGGGEACDGPDDAATCSVDVGEAEDRVLRASFVSEQRITVNLTGDGTGTVVPVADPPSPNWTCTASQCTGDFAFGQTVSFTPQTTGANHLEGFSSSVSSCDGATCSVTVGTVDITIGAEFEVERELRVSVLGSTGGSVQLPASFAEAAPITCTANCSRVYLSGRRFTLIAQGPVNVVFDRWTGCNTVAGLGCEITMDADPKDVTAAFLSPQPLDISILGTGNARIDITDGVTPTQCSGAAPLTCPQVQYPARSTVTLTVPPTPGTDFLGWGGACSGASGPVCTVQMTAARSVTATFERRRYQVTVGFAGLAAASGRVTWDDPQNTVCSGPTPCSLTFDEGDTVRVTPASGIAYQFEGWDGCSDVLADNSCRIRNISQDVTITARFVPLDEITLALAGSGTGRIVWETPAEPTWTCQIGAPGTCLPRRRVVRGTQVELVAESANANTRLVGWTTCPSAPVGGRCRFTVAGTTTVAATFAEQQAMTILLGGDGVGRVRWSSPTTFPDCVPGTCPARDVDRGTTVVLTAQPVAGATFTGWSPPCVTSGLNNETCTLSAVSQDLTVTAEYFRDRTVSVEVQGPMGTQAGVQMTVGGVQRHACPINPLPYTCTYPDFAYTDGTVTVSVQTSSTTSFLGWSPIGSPPAGCVGTSCVIDIQTALTHTRQAQFN